MSSLRRRTGWTLVGLSLLLHVFTVYCFARQPDRFAAFTVLPIWIWGGFGLLFSTVAFYFLRAPLSLIMTAVWAVTLLVGADEARIIANLGNAEPLRGPAEPVDGKRALRVVTLNCALYKYGNPAKDLAAWEPDIVLLQDVFPDHVRQIADALYGGRGDYRFHNTSGIVTRWKIKREIHNPKPTLRNQQLAIDNQLTGIKGIGEALRDKLHELASTASLKFHQDLRAEFPEGLFELFELQGLGPKKVKVLHESLGVGSLANLKTACNEGKVAALPGFGEKTQTKIREAIALHETFEGSFLLGDVTPLVTELLETLRLHPEISRVAVAGSFRRAKETLHDLDFLVATKEGALVCEDFTTLPQVESIIACGDTKASVRLKTGIQVDLRAVSNDQFPFALQYFTGSKEHNVALRSLALKQGLSLNEYGFTVAAASSRISEIPSDIHEERDIYQALGLDFIEPELRENRGELEAAAEHQLPRLVHLDNLRGTFHNHTTESDGTSTLEEMADEAQELGLQYLGIADHSKSMVIANGLSPERLLKQVETIQTLNSTFTHFRLFAGSEVDILKDGSLDFDDPTLAKLDYCVASVHNIFNLPEDEMTRRICRAMENERVTMLGYLTGRLLLKREGYAVNHGMIIDCAAETRTIIELNCNPWRLDMDWRWWKRARDKGVLCSINPDAHSTMGLHFLGIGARLARKGWLRKQDVFNTRSTADVEKFLKTPKAQR